MSLVDRYRYHVNWSELDRKYIATCDEFPNLRAYARDQQKALALLKMRVVQAIYELEQTGVTPPVPHGVS